MSNVLYFQQALEARNARAADRAGFLSGVGGLGAAPVEKVRQAQIALTFVGFPAGEADGLWGPNTERAVRAFAEAANVPLPPDGTQGSAAYLTPAFDAALGRAVAARKGTAAAPVPGMAPAASSAAPAAIQAAQAAAAAASAQMPPLERAKQWLLAPGQPVYKKPVLYIGAGILGLTIFLALRGRD